MTANRQALPARRTDSRTAPHGPGRHLAVAAVMAVLMAACVYAVKTLSLFISPMLFLAAVFLGSAVGIAVIAFRAAREHQREEVQVRDEEGPRDEERSRATRG